MAKVNKSSHLVYPKERLISDLDRETGGSKNAQTKPAVVRNTPPHLVRAENMPTARRDPLLATSWKEIENSAQTKRVHVTKKEPPLATSSKEVENSAQTKPAEAAKKEPSGTSGTKSRESIQESEKAPSRRSSRRLSEYRDSDEILEILRERKESKLKRLALQKEKRLSEHREEEECIGKAAKQGRRETKEVDKEFERRNSRRKSDTSKDSDVRKRSRRLSEYRDYDEMIAQNKNVAKARERELRGMSISRPSEVIANQGQDTTKATDAGPKDAQ